MNRQRSCASCDFPFRRSPTFLGPRLLAITLFAAFAAPGLCAESWYNVPDLQVRRDLEKTVADSDLDEATKRLYRALVMQKRAWKSGLVHHLGIAEIGGHQVEPELIRRVFLSFELSDADASTFTVFFADKSRSDRRAVGATYIVTDDSHVLKAWQITPIDGPYVVESELKENTFPAVLRIAEDSRHNGDRGHFEFTLRKDGISRGQDYPPPHDVLKKMRDALLAKERALTEKMSETLRPRFGEAAETVAADFFAESKQWRAEYAEQEVRYFDMSWPKESQRFGFRRMVAERELIYESFENATKDARRAEYEELLREAVRRRLPRAVKVLLSADIDVNMSVGDNDSLLRMAVTYASQPSAKEIAELLLDAGADPNRRTSQGDPLLWETIRQTGDEEIVSLLLKHGADVNATDRLGRNTLHLLSSNSHLESSPAIARILVDAGGDVNNATRDGETIMHVAVGSAASCPSRPGAFERSIEFLEILLDEEPDLSKRNRFGHRPLDPERGPAGIIDEGRLRVLDQLKGNEAAKSWIDGE